MRTPPVGSQLVLHPVEFTWGGRRPGAGRKPANTRTGVRHRTRPEHKSRHPVHVTLRSELACLRDRRFFPAIRNAIASSSRPGFGVVHFSVQANHVHLLVEALDSTHLSRGVRGLIVRTARALNRVLGRSGPVWNNRYHRHDLRTPREVRNALVYVLQNWKKHVAGAGGVDRCSSGPWFDGWREHVAVRVRRTTIPVEAPVTWLASAGWRRLGLISLAESPRDSVSRPR